jgi:hypothetical protein
MSPEVEKNDNEIIANFSPKQVFLVKKECSSRTVPLKKYFPPNLAEEEKLQATLPNALA